MTTNKILVISTGGTIGTVVDSNGNRTLEDKEGLFEPVHENVKSKLVEKYLEFNSSCNIVFNVIQRYNILSENSDIGYSQYLIDTLITKLNEDTFDGVIILHGTDTLAYTEALIKAIKCKLNISIPIKFAFAYSSMPSEGENYVTRFQSWDGYKNFENAVEEIMLINDSRVNLLVKPSYNTISLNKNIVVIKAFPGMNADVFNFDNMNDYNVIIEGYHSCTIPVEVGKKFIESNCKEIYVCSNESFSETYQSMIDLNIHARKKNRRGIHFITGLVPDVWARLVVGLRFKN